jgi:hypothetical protein
MNQRDILSAAAEAYREGYARALEISKAEIETRVQTAEIAEARGIRIGRNQVLKEMEGVQWGKLKRIVFSYSFFACLLAGGIILAVVIGIALLPR